MEGIIISSVDNQTPGAYIANLYLPGRQSTVPVSPRYQFHPCLPSPFLKYPRKYLSDSLPHHALNEFPRCPLDALP
jgi:hypothetical protein